MEQNSLQPTVSRWNRFRSSTGVVVACCFLMIFTSLGFCSSPKSFFLNVVAEELGVERTAFAINDTFRYVTTAILSVFFSAIFNKLGTKKMIVLGFGLLISSQCLYAVATNVLVFCIGGALLGAGLAMVSNTLASHIVKSRCTKNVGTIQGIVLAANGLGGAVATQLVDYFIRNHGYKSAYFMVAAVLLGVGVILVTLFMEDKSEAKMGPSKKKARGQVWEGISYNEGKRRGYFIPLCIMMFLTGCVLTGVNGIAKAHWEDVGITGVANIWSIHSLVLITGKFLTGFFYDKKGLRMTLLICQGVTVAALTSLILASNTPFGIGCAWFYSIFSAYALPLETIGVSLVTGDIFGSRDFAKFLGIMSAMNYAGYAVGSPAVNLVYDNCGTYVPAIIGAVVIMAVVIIGFQFVINAARKEQKALSVSAQEK